MYINLLILLTFSPIITKFDNCIIKNIKNFSLPNFRFNESIEKKFS